jgi:hypothetical protein
VTPRRVAAAAVDLALALALGPVARLAHGYWYRFLDSSVALDLAGSAVLGAVLGVGHVLVASADRAFGGVDRTADSRAWRPRSVAAATAVGFLSHVAVAPAFTPFDLGIPGVNATLTAVGAAVGLWSLRVRRTARRAA